MTGELITDSSEDGENITALPFSKWSSSIGVDIQDQKDQYVGYGNYLRDFEFDQGTLDQDTEEVIARNTFQKIREIDPEYVPSLELGTIDSDAALIYEAFGQQARDDFYTAVNEAGASRDDFLDEVNSAKQYLVEHDRLGLASLKQVDDDGVTSFRVIGGSNLVNPRQSITDSINRGAFLHNNMAQVNEGLKKTPYGQTLFKAIRNDKISGEFSKAANNSKIKDSYLEIIKDAKNHFITDKEKGAPSALIAKARTLLAKQYSSESDITEDVARNRFQDADIMDALEQVSIMDAYQGGTAKFVSEPDKIDENIKVTKTGIAVPHINLILNKGQFETAIELKAGKGELTNAQVRNLYAGRTAYLTRNYPAYEELFKDSTVEKKWQNHVLKSQKLGQSKAEILDAFIANPKNYSGVKNRIGSFVDSLKDSFTGLFFVLPALLKNETSINILVEQEEDRQNRRQVASIFGDHLGWVHDISTAIAPMVVDVAATGFLISRGMSVGGAGYIGAKEGAKLTAKGLAKSFTGSVLVKEFGESSAEAAARLSATKYIKEGATTKSIQKAIESYSALVGTKLVNNKVVRGRAAENVITSSIFLTAANRSAGGTYATIYSNYDGTHEEKHDKAFGSAMLAAMATGLITAAFSRFGRGGFENVLLGGLSFGQMNYVLGKLSRSKVSPLDTQQIIGNHLKSRMKEISPSIFKSLYGKYAKAGTEEFLEEGIDEFVNSFIVSSALKIDTPMLDRISDSIYAGSIGGVIGQGASAIRTSAQKRNAFMRGDIEIFRQKEINELLAKLEATSSPLTRDAVIQRTESLLRGEDISDADYQAYLEEVDKIDKQDQEDTGRPLQTSREQESERAPDKLPPKELEEVERVAREATRYDVGIALSESLEVLPEMLQQDRIDFSEPVEPPTESEVQGKKTYEGFVKSLEPNQVFVFGSNLDGFHGAGSAGYASFNEGGNVWRKYNYGSLKDGTQGKWNVKGQSEGYQEGTEGRSYAIPTVVKAGGEKISDDDIKTSIRTLYAEAANNPELEYLVANGVGSGLSGYTGQEFARMYVEAGEIPSNVVFKNEFQLLMDNVGNEPTPISSKEDFEIPDEGIISDDSEYEQVEFILSSGVERTQPTPPVAEPKVVYVDGTGDVYKEAAKGKGINTLRQSGVGEKHFGNPFKVNQKYDASKPEVVAKYKEVVNNYGRWLRGDEEFKNKESDRREWILEQIDAGNLDGQNLLYYTNIPHNHAKELKKVVLERRAAAPPVAKEAPIRPTKKDERAAIYKEMTLILSDEAGRRIDELISIVDPDNKYPDTNKELYTGIVNSLENAIDQVIGLTGKTAEEREALKAPENRGFSFAQDVQKWQWVYLENAIDEFSEGTQRQQLINKVQGDLIERDRNTLVHFESLKEALRPAYETNRELLQKEFTEGKAKLNALELELANLRSGENLEERSNYLTAPNYELEAQKEIETEADLIPQITQATDEVIITQQRIEEFNGFYEGLNFPLFEAIDTSDFYNANLDSVIDPERAKQRLEAAAKRKEEFIEFTGRAYNANLEFSKTKREEKLKPIRDEFVAWRSSTRKALSDNQMVLSDGASTALTEYKGLERSIQGQSEAALTEMRSTVSEEIERVNKGLPADRYTGKELKKVAIATQFIGDGVERKSNKSSSLRYKIAWELVGKANTGVYSSDDVVMLAANTARTKKVQASYSKATRRKPAPYVTETPRIKPFANSDTEKDVTKWQPVGVYRHLKAAMNAGASFVADPAAHLERTKRTNIGEVELALYLLNNGYKRVKINGKPTGKFVPKNADVPLEDGDSIVTLSYDTINEEGNIEIREAKIKRSEIPNRIKEARKVYVETEAAIAKKEKEISDPKKQHDQTKLEEQEGELNLLNRKATNYKNGLAQLESVELRSADDVNKERLVNHYSNYRKLSKEAADARYDLKEFDELTIAGGKLKEGVTLDSNQTNAIDNSLEELRDYFEDDAKFIEGFRNDLTEAAITANSFGLPFKLLSREQHLESIPVSEAVIGERVSSGIKAFSLAKVNNQTVVLINPFALEDLVSDASPLNRRAMIRSGVSEEIIHAAAIYELDEGEVQKIWDSLSEDEKQSTANTYYPRMDDAKVALRRLSSEDADTVNKEKFILGHEYLRMKLQKITDGSTTEEVAEQMEREARIAGEDSNAAFVLRSFKKYLKSYFNKLFSLFSRDTSNPYVTAAVDRIHSAYKSMGAGYQTQGEVDFDPENPLQTLNTLKNALDTKGVKEEAIEGTLLSSGVGGDSIFIRHGNLAETLTIPIATTGEYRGKYKGIRTFYNSIVGSYDPRLRQLFQSELNVRNTVFREIKKYQETLKSLEKKHYPNGDAPVQLFKDITGDGNGLRLHKETRRAIEKIFGDTFDDLEAERQAQVSDMEDEAKQTDMNRREINEAEAAINNIFSARREVLNDRRIEVYNKAYAKQKVLVTNRRTAAIEQLGGFNEDGSPKGEIANHLYALRKKVDAMSESIKEKALAGEVEDHALNATIDNNLEVYLTTSYRLFTEGASYVTKVMSSPLQEYANVREGAYKFFKKIYIQQRAGQLLLGAKDPDGNLMREIPKTQLEAERVAEAELSTEKIKNDPVMMDKSPVIKQMMIDFLNSYNPNDPRMEGDHPSWVGEDIRPHTYSRSEHPAVIIAAKKLKQRANIPKELIAFMGKEKDTTGYDAISKTYMHTGMLAANFATLRNLLEFGVREENGWILTQEQLTALPDEKRKAIEIIDGKKKEVDQWVDLKTRARPEFDMFKLHAASMGSDSLYVRKDMHESLKELGSSSALNFDYTTDAAKVSAAMTKWAGIVTGTAMGAKTLGSIGFYERNALGNIAFFAPAQGIIAPIQLSKALWNEMKRKKGFFFDGFIDPEQIDPYYSKLERYGLLEDELRPKMLDELIFGETSPQDMYQELDEITGELVSHKDIQREENVVRRLLKDDKKGIGRVFKGLKSASAAMDAFFKIYYFEHELNTLKEARDFNMENNPYDLSDTELEFLAAEKVKRTAQSYSEASPLVKGLASSPYGLMLAPFIRFKGELIRISVNSIKLIHKEINDTNPVIRKRGFKRLGGNLFTIVGLSAIAPVAVRMVSGISDDEDEALRRTLVSYLRKHTYYLFKSGDDLYSLDMTYVNPYSLIVDPFLRSLEKGLQGESAASMGATFAKALFADEFLDQQIFAGAFTSLLNNRDPQTDKKIWLERDTAEDSFAKGLNFLWREAFEPRTFRAISEAATLMGTNQLEDALKRMGREVLPAKPFKLDLSNNMRRYLYDIRRETQELSLRKNAVLGRAPMGDTEIKELIQKEIEHRIRLDKEVAHTLTHLRTLAGWSNKDMASLVKSAQFGQRRYNAIMGGRTETPAETHKGLKKKLMDRYEDKNEPEYLRRLKLLDSLFKSYPQYFEHADY